MLPTSTPNLPQRVSPGDPVRAADFNAVIDALRVVSGIGVGEGLTIRRTSGGIVIGRLDSGAAETFPATVEAVTVAVGSGAYLPSDVRYTARVIGRPDIEPLGPVLPTYGRPVKGDEFGIYPAAPGDFCLIVRRPARDNSGGTIAELWIATERVAGCAPA